MHKNAFICALQTLTIQGIYIIKGKGSSMNTKENSPFTPGSPVPVELFIGRVGQITEISRYVEQASSGKQENVFFNRG
jgi:hypothetical protein